MMGPMAMREEASDGDGGDGNGPHDGADASGVGEVDRGQGRSVREIIDFWERVGDGGGGGSDADQVGTRLVMDGRRRSASGGPG